MKFELDNHHVYQLPDFILIVDFDNRGGGTTTFLNCIVSRYKYSQTFLIVRRVKERIVFNVNEEFKIKLDSSSIEQAMHFLRNVEKKIIKIFVNHTIGHTHDFISFLFKLNKHMTTITHDYYCLFTLPQPFYHEIINVHTERNKVDIN